MFLNKKFLESSLVGIVSTLVGQLGVSYYLDSIIGTNKSNIVGLIVEAIIDFFGQEYAFTGKIHSSSAVTEKFIAGKIISILLSQVLFFLILPKLKLIKNLFGKWTITIGRFFIGVIIFLFVTYPLRKYWVFKKKQADENKHENENKIK